MKFRCERDTLAEAVATAQRAVASRTGAMPVLSGLRVTLSAGSLELVGTDLELTIRVRIPADTEGEGSAVVPARLFSEIVRQLDGDTVSVELADDDAKIEAGRFATTLRTLSAAEFPRLPEAGEGGVRVESTAFAEALRQVVPGASRDDARPILTGVLLTASAGGLRLVATDSYRLALRDLQGVSMLEEGQKVLVAAKGLGEVQRLLSSETGEIEVVLGEREVVFRVGTTEVTTRLIEGEFPNYQQLIPSGYPNRLTVSRDQLQAAVNRVRLVGQSKDTAPIRLAMGADGLELSAIAQDVGEAHESVEAKYEGTDVTVAFNSQFLLDGIDAAASDEVVIESIDPLKPAVMKATDSGDFLYLLMPVRIAYAADALDVHLAGLWLTDFRCYEAATLHFPPGVTVICGANAQGKTSLLEAVGWAATGKSFRGVPDSALVRAGQDTAILRAEVVDEERVQLLEAEIRASGRNRVQLNRNAVQRTRDLLGLMRVTVFAPDDLQLVKGGPSGRRDYLDDLLAALSPRYEAARADYERVLRQRNALLRGGLRGEDAVGTLDVFDLQLAAAGAELARGRVKLLERLVPAVADAYAELAGERTPITTTYEAEWAPGGLGGAGGLDGADGLEADLHQALLDAFASHRKTEVDRGVTLVGPHRDEWRLLVGGMESRTHASQGEQRTLALALRLGGHRLSGELTGSSPVLLLDDVFSELDDQRAVALVAHLDSGQTLVTTAGTVPRGISADRMLRVDAGRVEEAA